MNSMASTIWQGVLYTNNNNANTNVDANTDTENSDHNAAKIH